MKCVLRGLVIFLILVPSFVEAQEDTLFRIKTITGGLDIFVPDAMPEGCQNPKFRDPEQIKKELEEDFNVLVEKNSLPFDTGLLIFFREFLIAFNLQFEKPLTISRTDKVSPELVKLKEKEDGNARRNVLEFSRNAHENLFINKVNQAYEEAITNTEGIDDEGFLAIDFNNTLFLQLTSLLVPRDRMEDLFLDLFGIDLSAVPTENYKEHVVEFRIEELAIILKQLIDIPGDQLRYITEGLNHIFRLERGYQEFDPVHGPRLADYNPATKTLRVFDAAFSGSASSIGGPEQDNDLRGERTLLHEFGHIVYFGILFDAPDLIQRFNALKKQGVGYMLGYAQKDPLEDWAVHYSFYVENGPLLKARVPEKYDFFKNEVFDGVEYLPDGVAYAKLYLKNEMEDRTAPTFPPLSKSLTIRFEIDPDDGPILFCRLQGVFDNDPDMSLNLRLVPTDGDLSSTQTFYRTCHVSINNLEPHCIDRQKGTYEFKSPINLDRYPKSKFEIASGSVSDSSGNYTSANVEGAPIVDIPGNWHLKPKRYPDGHPLSDPELQDQIFVQSVATDIGREVYQVTLPLKHPNDLSEVEIRWASPDRRHSNGHRIYSQHGNGRSYGGGFISKPGDAFIKFQVAFIEEFDSITYVPRFLKIGYIETEEFRDESRNEGYEIYLDHDRVLELSGRMRITTKPTNTDDTEAEAIVEEIKLEIVEFKDRDGHPRKGIRVVVPVRGMDKGRPDISVTVKGPDGKTFRGGQWNTVRRVERDPAKVRDDGVKVYNTLVDLPKQFAEGEYLLESVEVKENYETPGFDPEVIEGARTTEPNTNIHDHSRIKQHFFRERKIEKKIKIIHSLN